MNLGIQRAAVSFAEYNNLSLEDAYAILSGTSYEGGYYDE